jgi:hypothetical protein
MKLKLLVITITWAFELGLNYCILMFINLLAINSKEIKNNRIINNFPQYKKPFPKLPMQ